MDFCPLKTLSCYSLTKLCPLSSWTHHNTCKIHLFSLFPRLQSCSMTVGITGLFFHPRHQQEARGWCSEASGQSLRGGGMNPDPPWATLSKSWLLRTTPLPQSSCRHSHLPRNISPSFADNPPSPSTLGHPGSDSYHYGFILILLEFYICLRAKLLQSWPTLCDSMGHSPSGSSVHGILQVRILECVAISFSRGPLQPRFGTCVSYISSTSRQVLYHQCHLGSPKWRIILHVF